MTLYKDSVNIFLYNCKEQTISENESGLTAACDVPDVFSHGRMDERVFYKSDKNLHRNGGQV